jgi:hypothetical protein
LPYQKLMSMVTGIGGRVVRPSRGETTDRRSAAEQEPPTAGREAGNAECLDGNLPFAHGMDGRSYRIQQSGPHGLMNSMEWE